MKTAVKQTVQPKSANEPSLVPVGVKKVMQQTSEKENSDKKMSGNLSRMLDACSDCV